jgi:hypothetical protein
VVLVGFPIVFGIDETVRNCLLLTIYIFSLFVSCGGVEAMKTDRFLVFLLHLRCCGEWHKNGQVYFTVPLIREIFYCGH